MKITKEIIPENMKETMGGIPANDESTSKTLKSLKELESLNTKRNVKAVFFINLTYVIGLIFLTLIALQTGDVFVIATITVTTIGALVFNLFTYKESKKTIKNLEIIKKLEKLDED